MIGIKYIFSLTLILVVIFTLILVLTKKENTFQKENTFREKSLVAQNSNLTTDAEACKMPVKFIGSAKGEACFSCEHGTENQHVVCTSDTTEKTALFNLVDLSIDT